MKSITWEDICEAEPRVKALYYTACHVKDCKTDRSFCANYVFLNTFKPIICELVGFCRSRRKKMMKESANDFQFENFFAYTDEIDDEMLSTSIAYDIVYQKIYGALPDCRNCCCISLW